MNSPNDKHETVMFILLLVVGLMLIFGSMVIDLVLG